MADEGADGDIAHLANDPGPPSGRPSHDSANHLARLAQQAARMPACKRRNHLLDVASEIIVEHGALALTMEGLAAQAGVSKGLGYAYFANRDEIRAAVFEREIAELDRRVAAATSGAESFEARVRGTVGATFDTLAERGVLMGRLLRHETAGITSPLAARQRERQRADGAVLRQARSRGVRTAGARWPRRPAPCCWSGCPP